MIYSAKLSKFKEIFHGFTTKEEGNFKLTSFGQKMPIGKICPQSKQLVLVRQSHGDEIKLVKALKVKDEIVVFEDFDGLVSLERGLALGIRTADCLPILFYEPITKIVAALHAGWKGTILGTSQKMVKRIENLGGKAKNIVVAIGPHIGMCCYKISQERMRLFEKKFGQNLQMISIFDGEPHLDLACVNFWQLLISGVQRENIDVPPTCTSCNKGLFFSYRRSKKEEDKYGEMLAVIGLI